MQDKEIWIAKNYPMISEYLFLSRDKSKTNTILDYCNRHNIDLKDAVFVDDIIPFLREVERKGIRSFHISNCLDGNIKSFSKAYIHKWDFCIN